VHAPPLTGVYGKAGAFEFRRDCDGGRSVYPRFDPAPGKQISAGYDNLMPSFTGHISEAEIMQIIAT
jgi:hypothetical protein